MALVVQFYDRTSEERLSGCYSIEGYGNEPSTIKVHRYAVNAFLETRLFEDQPLEHNGDFVILRQRKHVFAKEYTVKR